MTFYTDMAVVANELIAEFGADVVFRRTSGGTFDPVTGLTTGATTSDNTAKGIQKTYKASLIDGTRIKNGDKLYVIDDGYVPDMGDKLKVASEYWSIVDIQPMVPADTPIVYFVQARK